MRRNWSSTEDRLAEEEGLSVEEVVSLIQGLPQGQHIPDAAYQSLFHFDSRAAALLLKDLSKAGLGHRAVQLFDWLRKLDEAHPLHALCDVYTYTAMISMCIYQQVGRIGSILAEFDSPCCPSLLLFPIAWLLLPTVSVSVRSCAQIFFLWV